VKEGWEKIEAWMNYWTVHLLLGGLVDASSLSPEERKKWADAAGRGCVLGMIMGAVITLKLLGKW
jgi:hypothetical protein